MYDRMFAHQREGVAWLWGLHLKGDQQGGILADDMGMGKTFQVSKRLIVQTLIQKKGKRARDNEFIISKRKMSTHAAYHIISLFNIWFSFYSCY